MGQSQKLLKPKAGAVTLTYWQTKTLLVQSASLVALWPQRDLTGTTCTDASPNGLNGVHTNVTLAQPGIGDSGKSALYDGLSSFTNLYSAGLNTAFNKGEFTILQWLKVGASVWATANYQYIIRFYADASNDIAIYAGNSAGYLRFMYAAGGVNKYRDHPGMTDTGWLCLGMTVSKSNDRLRPFVNGTQYLTDVTGLGTWVGAFNSGLCALGSRYGTSFNLGINAWFGPSAVWSKELTPAEVASLASPFDVVGILFIGDSKTDADSWRTPLCNALTTKTGRRWTELPQSVGIGGITTALMAARCDADIAAMAGLPAPREISINLGANDVNGVLLASDWETNTRYILNAYHTRFPTSNIRLTKVWKRACAGGIALANAIIDTIYADYTWLKPHIDEALFLPGSDDGATTTADGVHPNEIGGALEAAALQTVMGF